MPEHQVPSSFRLLCEQAQRGGPGTFELVGKVFFSQTVAKKSSTQDLVELLTLLKADYRLPVAIWIFDHYPAYAHHIPVEKHLEFVKGLFACATRLEQVVLPRRTAESVNYFFAEPPSFLPQLNPSPN